MYECARRENKKSTAKHLYTPIPKDIGMKLLRCERGIGKKGFSFRSVCSVYQYVFSLPNLCPRLRFIDIVVIKLKEVKEVD